MALSACKSSATNEPTRIEVVKGGYFRLIAPEQMDTPAYVMQVVNGEYRGRSYQFMAQIEIDRNRLTFVASSPLGIPLFTTFFADNDISSDVSSIIEGAISPANMLADYQLAYCSAQLLHSRLSDTQLSVREVSGGRDIYWQDRNIIQIRYQAEPSWQGKVIYRHLEWDYTITSETISMEDS